MVVSKTASPTHLGLLRTGLKQQAVEQLAIANAECNQLRWAPPTVVFHFAGGASAEVAGTAAGHGHHRDRSAGSLGAEPCKPVLPP